MTSDSLKPVVPAARPFRQNDPAFLRQTKANFGGGQPALFWLSAVVVLLIFTLNLPFLNLFVNYTIPGGSVFSKFHPASYAAALLLFLMLEKSVAAPMRFDRHLFKFLGVFLVLMGYCAIMGKGAFAAIIVDIYIAPIILLLALSRLDTESVRKICALFVWIAVANAIVVMIDYLRGKYTLPVFQFLLYQDFFRPAGFAGHPTMASAMSTYAIFFVLAGAVSSNLRRPLMLVLFLSVVLCKERSNLALSGLIILINFFRPLSPRENQWDYIIDFGMVFVIPALIFAAFLYGAFDRILVLGIWDASSQSRFLIYNSLSLISHEQFMYGVSNDVGTYLAEKTVKGEYVESSIVIAIFAAGFPFACAYFMSILSYYWPYMKKNLLFSVFVLVAATTGNSVSVKNITPAALALLGYFLCRRAQTRRASSKTLRPLLLPQP